MKHLDAVGGHRSAILIFAVIASLGCLLSNAADSHLSLAGRWRFELDRDDAGVRERWFEHRLSRRIKLPGSLPAQGVGDPVSVDTKWIGGIVDRSWFTKPQFAKYRGLCP